MKWMGGWSWRELIETPQDMYDTILEMIQEEAEELENR